MDLKRRKRLVRTVGGVLGTLALLWAGTVLVRGGPGGAGGLWRTGYDFSDWDGTAVFLGDSITDFCDLENYYPGLNAVNQGISGETTGQILERMDRSVYAYEPQIVVVLGGVNDILIGYSDDTVVENMRSILSGIRRRLPGAEVILQSIYPVAEGEDLYYTGHIRAVNARLEQLAAEQDCRYVDLFSALCAKDGRLDGRYSDDGLHPNDAGYRAVCPRISAALERAIAQSAP